MNVEEEVRALRRQLGILYVIVLILAGGIGCLGADAFVQSAMIHSLM